MVTLKKKNVFEASEGPLFSYDGKNVFLNNSCLSLLNSKYCQVLVDENYSGYLWIRPCNSGDWGARKVHYVNVSLKKVCYKNALPTISHKFQDGSKNHYSVKWDNSVSALCGTVLESNNILSV